MAVEAPVQWSVFAARSAGPRAPFSRSQCARRVLSRTSLMPIAIQHDAVSRPEACSRVRRAKLDEQWTMQTPGASDSPARSSLHMHWFGRSTDAGVATDCMHMLRAAAARAALRGVQRACLSCSRAFATGEQAYVFMPCCDCLCR